MNLHRSICRLLPLALGLASLPPLASTGTFHTGTDYTVGLNPNATAVGDFNGDGKADLAVANRNSNTVSILLGNGDAPSRRASTIARAPSQSM